MIGVSAATAPAPVTTASKNALFPEPLIDRKLFVAHNQACRVRQVFTEYENLLEAASDEGTPVEEYMKNKGIQDMSAFRLTCPTFGLFCWPSELAELGSGVVLYFHFLAFLAGFLFIAFLIQLPAVVEYVGKDNLEMWKLYNNVDDGRKDATMMDDIIIFTSPGHLGPKMGDKPEVPFCYFLLVSALAAAIVAKSAWQVWVDYTCDEEVTHPNDFAIMVEGFPATATNEEDIVNFFKQHAVRGSNETEVVKVVIGWTADEYRAKMREFKQLRVEMSDLDPVADAEVMKEAQQKMAAVGKDLQAVGDGTGGSRLHSSGVVVVSFRYQTDMRSCLDRWTGIWGSWFYCDWGGCCGMLPGPSLPKLPTATGIGVWKLRVRRAPNPGDINWDDLGVSRRERWCKMAETNGCMLLVIVVSFGITFAMATIKEGTDNTWLGLLPAIGLMFANVLMVLSASHFGAKEFHNTVTGQTASQALKMTLGMIFNTGGVILLINRKDWQWYQKAGLVSDIFWLMGLTAVMQPLFQLFDMKYKIAGCTKRKQLTDDRMKTLREGAVWYNTNGVTDADKDKFVSFKQEYLQTVAVFKRAFESSEMDMKKRYAYAVRNFVCCMLFCHIAPFISLVGIIGLAVQYWVDKYMITSWYKTPSIQWGKDQADMSLTFLRFTTLLMPLCMWFFLDPSYKENKTLIWWMICSYAPAVGICILPLSTIRWILCAPCRGRGSARIASSDSREDYYKAQYLWPREQKYHKSHGLYKFLGEAKNPEFFDPNVSATTKADDITGSYGASTAAVLAAGSTAKPTAGVPGVTPTMVTPAPTTTPTVTPTVVAPTVVGSVTTGVVSASGGKDSTKESDKHTSAKTGGALWERQCKHGFQPFEAMCQEHIENQYQKWQAKGKSGEDARISVRIDDKGTKVSMDFEKMTSMLMKRKGGHGHAQKIQRTPAP